VPEYRVYFINRTDIIIRPPETVACANDAEATQKAKQLVDGHDVELWEGPRLVIGIKSK
jgi:hypothetical protein